jgi:hypothetical protein
MATQNVVIVVSPLIGRSTSWNQRRLGFAFGIALSRPTVMNHEHKGRDRDFLKQLFQELTSTCN